MDKLTKKFLANLKFKTTSGEIVATNKKQKKSPVNLVASLGIIMASLGLTYAPLLSQKTTITIVTGSELKEPLVELEQKFEQENSRVDLEIKIQGSQDIVSNFIDQKNDFTTTILMPANDELITELQTRLNAQGEKDIFYEQPQAIAKTILVGIAWEERGKVLFPQGKFSWNRIETALQQRNWQNLGGQKDWGSFDFLTTDPLRSNSGQITLSLWAKDELKTNNLTTNNLNNSEVEKLFQLIKNRVYQPPRSTDILLQEFIARGPNDADVATVYESIALHRWLQVQDSKTQRYQIYYPNPSIETTITAVISKKNVSKSEAKIAQKFIDFLQAQEQQIILAKYGLRPIINLDLQSLPNTPWNQNIPGVEVNPNIKINPSPNQKVMDEIQKIWYRS